jgi:ribosomal protein S12 methylthiotransferase
VGAFTYSYEAATPSAALPGQVPEAVKQARYNLLMETQQPISHQINQSFVGETLDVLVEGFDKGLSYARSYRDAPEIDGMVIVEGELPAGRIVPVRITGAMVYDLTGTVDTVPPRVAVDAAGRRALSHR